MGVLVADGVPSVALPLRWPGGRRWLLPVIRKLVGTREFSSYHEPFLGGALVFLVYEGSLGRTFGTRMGADRDLSGYSQ
jgi:site-specific DNA-adenine methylase